MPSVLSPLPWRFLAWAGRLLRPLASLVTAPAASRSMPAARAARAVERAAAKPAFGDELAIQMICDHLRDQPVALGIGMDVDLQEQPLTARGALAQDAGEVEIGHAELVETPRERRCQFRHRALEQRLEGLPLGRKQGDQEL